MSLALSATVSSTVASMVIEEKPSVAPPEEKAAEPFAFADFTWIPGNWGATERPMSWGPFVGELRVDTVYHWELSDPKDDTISGPSEVFRHGEVQVTQIGIAGTSFTKARTRG